MRLKQYDPPKSISYTRILGQVIRHFDELRGHDDFVRAISPQCLSDITHFPEMENGSVRLYDGGDERIYQFRESDDRGGTLEVVFNGSHLESFSARLYFSGIWGKARAAVYSSLGFARLINGLVGRDNIRYDDASHNFFCYRGGLVICYTHRMELGTPSISTHIASRQDCVNCASGDGLRHQAACSIC